MRKQSLIAVLIVAAVYSLGASQIFRSAKFVSSATLPVSYSFLIPGSGSQAIPVGAVAVRIRVYGSGGGGQSKPSDIAGGGGGGGFSDKSYTIAGGDAGKTIPWMVGAGGGAAATGQSTTCGSATLTLNSVSLNQAGGAGHGGTTTSGGIGGTGTGGSTNHTGSSGSGSGVGTGGPASDSGTGYGGDGNQSPGAGQPGGPGSVVMDFS